MRLKTRSVQTYHGTNQNAHFNVTQCVNNYLVYTTQVNSTFHTCCLARTKVISQVQVTSEQPKKNKMAFHKYYLSQIKLLFGLLVILSLCGVHVY